ncbi:MAG: UTP--glucose-1-phosphate uridylyltransferase [Clostridiales bacterium]|nr:UTP--glucose-1-phosphate uridylyltransferase [Clostridiales bacterium]
MKKVTKAIIPAAGLGTRFLPITKAVPKPMLSVIDKPTIQFICEELASSGIADIVIVVSPGSEVIKNHFSPAPELENRLLSDKKSKLYDVAMETLKYNVNFVVQETANGLAGAILCAEPYINGEPFALLLGDELIYAGEGDKPCIKRLIEIYESTGKSVIATMEVFGDDVSKYGNIGIKDETEDGVMTIERIVEKPSINEALSNNAIIGRYVMDGKVMDMLKTLTVRNNEIYFTDALDTLAANGEILASNFDGIRYDVGDKFGYVKANLEYALRSEELKDQTKELIKELYEKI